MLRNASSPETYFQAAFRVQSPWTITNPDDDALRVLVVDDEAMVREVVCAYLEREGFTTVEAIDGLTALAYDCFSVFARPRPN